MTSHWQGYQLQTPSHYATTGPAHLRYLPERPGPNSFGFLNSTPSPPIFHPYPGLTNFAYPQVAPTSWFTGNWPVLPTSYAIENNLMPEPPDLFGQYNIVDDPMVIDYPEVPMMASVWIDINPNSKKQPKRIAPTNISTIPLSKVQMQELSPW